MRSVDRASRAKSSSSAANAAISSKMATAHTVSQSGLQTVVRVTAINGSRAQVVRLAGNGVEVGRSFWTYLARPGTYGIPLP